jgi:putative peptidoglycan lipid II flippase
MLAVGNIASRAFGLLREIVIAALFGASGQVSAFRIAGQVSTLLYDLFIGGMLSAALVPVLSQTYEERRREFARLVSVLVGTLGLVFGFFTLLLLAFAPWVASLLAGGFRISDPELLVLTAQLIRFIAPAVWLVSMAGLAMAVLFALQRFTLPAMAGAIFNLTVVVAAVAFSPRIGIFAPALGITLGSLTQLIVMAWDVRRAGYSLRPRIDWGNPALREIFRLYLPVAAGIMVMMVQVAIDRRLASGTGAQSIAWMAAATTLQQLPLGLTSVAVSLAALPSLSRFFAARNEGAFRSTLGIGVRMIVLLIVPAAVAMAFLAEPVTELLFERGAFTPDDTAAVVAALRIYLIGMIFAAVDFPLNYAFYARSNTLLPTLVGIASVGIYLVVALPLRSSMGYLGLVWADTAKQAAHALIMLFFTVRVIGMPGVRTRRSVVGILAAAAAMALVCLPLNYLLSNALPSTALASIIQILAVGGAGALTYVAVLRVMRVEELEPVWRRIAPQRIMERLSGNRE